MEQVVRRNVTFSGNHGLHGLLLASSLLVPALPCLAQKIVFAPAAPISANNLPHLRELAAATSPFQPAFAETSWSGTAQLSPAPAFAPQAFKSQSSSFNPPASVEDLPVAPSLAAATIQPVAAAGGSVAPRDWDHVPASWQAVPLTSGDKVLLAVHDLYSVRNVASILVASGYSQLVNGQPNFGTDRGAFGQRLGAAAIRDSSQALLSTGLFADLLHEDPRYYVEGSEHGPVHRVLYAVTRPLITRRDEGTATINGAMILGYGSAAALTPLYYPASDRNAKDFFSTFGASLGGAALGNVINEFAAQVLAPIHLRHAR